MGQYRSKLQQLQQDSESESYLETFIGEVCSQTNSREIEFLQTADEDTCSRSDEHSQQQVDTIFCGLYQDTLQDVLANMSIEMSDISDIHFNKDIITPFYADGYFGSKKLQENQNQTEMYSCINREPEILSMKEFVMTNLQPVPITF